MPVEDLRQSPMMSHLLDALERGEDIGHYGRLTFAIVAHHFMDRNELVEWLRRGLREYRGVPPGEGLKRASREAPPELTACRRQKDQERRRDAPSSATNLPRAA
jgi:hypothetical protein